MSKKLVYLCICVFIYLSIGNLISLTTESQAQSRFPNVIQSREQIHPQLILPIPVTQVQKPQVEIQSFKDNPQLNALAEPIPNLEPVETSARLVVSHPVGIESIPLHIIESIDSEARIPQIVESYSKLQITPQLLGNQLTRQATECTVLSTNDSGAGTLRQCLENAVAGDTIIFDFTVFPPTNPVTITLTSLLPTIYADNLTIDASNAGVILDGSGLSSGRGLAVWGADGVKIQGLQILHFPEYGVIIGDGATNTTIGGNRFIGSGPLGQGNLISGNGNTAVWIQHTGTTNNSVLGNYIGTDISGTNSLRNQKEGIFIGYGASDNIIGGEIPGVRNLISGNGFSGVYIQDANTVGNQVLGNYIGTNASGTNSIGNENIGIFIGFGASNNIIGGETVEARNLISGNGRAGIWIQSMGSSGNQVLGNYIGTDFSGTNSVTNAQIGVFIGFGATNTIIGGETTGVGNLISGNGDSGVWIYDVGTSGNQVLGNYIGTDVFGTGTLPNYDGVRISFGATDNIVGGESPEARNLISGNDRTGIWIQDTATLGNQVLGNYIGTNVNGTGALGNGLDGVMIGLGATNNVIGGENPVARNLISGNGDAGIWIQNEGTLANQIIGNYIGTNIFGTSAIPNSRGVFIGFGASDHTISDNLISGNRDVGVWIQNEGTSANHIFGNHIGTDFSGTAPLGNEELGILIDHGATNNFIGGNSFQARNLISSNGIIGIKIEDSGTMSNTIQGNYIGTNVSGTIPLSNGKYGILIHSEATNNIVGGDTPGTSNLISGNKLAGICVEDVGTSENQVMGNYIGTDVSGTTALGNAETGVLIHNGATNNIIGGNLPEARNLISGNGDDGIKIEDSGTMSNTIRGNFIGTDASGTVPIANAQQGVTIHAEATHNTIGGSNLSEGNLISGNGLDGILIQDEGTSWNRVLGNYIGTDVSGTAPLGNGEYGVFIGFAATNNSVGIKNTIAYNSLVGVTIRGTNTLYNTVTQNAIYNNGGSGIETMNGGNVELASPTITEVTDTYISGRTHLGNIVEVFSDTAGEGRWFEGRVIADNDGFFTLTRADGFVGVNLTATATDTNGNTSEFAVPFRVFLPVVIKNSN
ncbi:MAG: hypothetical protein DWQ04_02770 [Chloroflexi bacterium]|nr:MAG: hypothetical protein DWQ04_02770 [Chloroflexota bacterium]